MLELYFFWSVLARLPPMNWISAVSYIILLNIRTSIFIQKINFGNLRRHGRLLLFYIIICYYHASYIYILLLKLRLPPPTDTPGKLPMFIDFNISIVSLSTSIASVLKADSSGIKSILRSLSSSWSFNEIPRTGPLWILFIKWVVKPAILFLKRFDGMMAISSAILLFVAKSRVNRE